ncbi:MAG: hypothetical protein CMJ78_05695 [Planctomycetaceae bacterium]|nr:hypothetical protein [Planctomycetaceae bacterium]
MSDQEKKAEAKKDETETKSDKIDPTKIKKVSEFAHDCPLTTCRVESSGHYAFAGAEDSNVYRWDLESGEKVALIGHESWIRHLEISADGKWLFTSGWDGQLGIWEVAGQATPIDRPKVEEAKTDEKAKKEDKKKEEKKPERLLNEPPEDAAATLAPTRMIVAHDGWVRACRMSPDGKTFATCGNDKLIKIWDRESLEVIATYAGHERHVWHVAFHPAGKELVSFDLMGVVKVWDLESGKEVRTIDGGIMQGYDNKFAADMGGAREIQFNSDGELFACSGITNVRNAFAGVQTAVVGLFDYKAGKHLRLLGDKGGDFQGICWGVRFHPEGYIIGSAASRGSSGVIWFWKPDNEKPFHTFKTPGGVRGMDMLADNRRLVTAENDGKLRVYTM